MLSNLVLKTAAKVSRIFITTKFFGKFFQKNFSEEVGSKSNTASIPFLAPLQHAR